MAGPSSDVAIRVCDLHKSYDDVEAVRGVSLELRKGEILALLGPNGAGKTTVVEILEGYRTRDSGEVEVLGHDPARRELRFRQRIGIVLQETCVAPYLTVEETVDLYGSYYPNRRPTQDVLEVTGLVDLRERRATKLSMGQQRRLDVATGLVGDPELLFLDEPTTGFDPAARRSSWKLIEKLRSLGKTVLLTTHYLEEAEHLADRVALIVKGKIVAEGTPEELKSQDAQTTISFRLDDGDSELPAKLGATPLGDGRFCIKTDTPTQTLAELTEWAADRELELPGLTVAHSTLEDIYLDLVGEAEAGSSE